MKILADTNVPEEYVSALRGDGHDVATLGPEATDDAITNYAEYEDYAILSTDVKYFGSREAKVPVFVAPQSMSGGDVRAAIARIEAIPFDPTQTDPLWLSVV
ncbi:DUF5615 family PIN-like protein [Halocatena marina]|uniref:DUF5615 family PIN-like protein n=1 Tax=Halocatena marina TaxID=2934937 RepID=UPI00200D3429|nr:DUF5615 family PIN-like protein [Halocatena marina]